MLRENDLFVKYQELVISNRKSMNLNLSLLFFFFLTVTSLYAQNQFFSIRGVVKEESGREVELTNVVLLKMPDSTEVTAVLTDTLGHYVFEGIAPGVYVVVGMQIGYERSLSSPILVEGNDVQSDILLKSEYKGGDEVVIAGRRPPVRQEGEKMIVDVENTLSNSGLTAVEVLRKSPGITVNKEGVITLKGKNGVLVMLDDKPLYMTEEQVGNLLKSIPSDQIKEIEIITTPSAKYDAAGNAGIINIKLKKGAYEGFNGTANGSYGQGVYHKVNAGLSASYKKKKLSLNGGYQYNNKKNLSDYYLHRHYNNPSSEFRQLNSDEYYKEPQETHNVNIGGSYDVTEKTSVSMNVIGGYAEYAWDGQSVSTLYKQNQQVKSSYLAKNVGVYRQTNINASLGTQHKLDTNGTVLSFDVNYNKFLGLSNKDFRLQNYDSVYQETGTPFLFLFRDPSYSNQFMAKTDFVVKPSKQSKLETGLKLNVIDQDNPATITITENGLPQDASNFYRYQENIYAGYAILHQTMGKFKLQGGLRLEHTRSNGVQRIQDTSFVREYTNLFPSANITYNQTDKTSYSLVYSRRIQRPTPWQMNPVLNVVDLFTSWGGNPALLPEYTDNVELNWSLFSGYLITTLNYTYINQPIRWALLIDESTLRTISQPRNLVLGENMGVSMALNMPLTKWWQTTNYVYVFHNRFRGDFGYGQTDNTVFSWNANSTQAFTISKKTSVEVSGNYQSSSVYALSYTAPRGQLTIAVQQKIWGNQASVKLAASDIFWSEGWNATTTLGTTDTRSGERWDSRVLMATFTYKFGKKLNLL